MLHNPRLSSDAFTAMEQLEERLLLSTGPVTLGDAEGADARSLVYSDTDGTQVTVQLKKGNATVHWAGPDVEWDVDKRGVAVVGALGDTAEIGVIELAGTGLKSALTFKTAKPKGRNNPFPDADKEAAIGGIRGAEAGVGIGSIAAAGIDILGFADGDDLIGIDLDGGAKQCTLGDVEGTPLLAFGGDEAGKLKFTGGHLGGASLTFAGCLTQLTVQSWAGGGDITVGEAPKITSKNGTFAANVVATQGSIGTVNVTAGDLAGSLTALNGMIGKIKVLAKVVYDKSGALPQAAVRGGSFTGNLAAGAVKGKSVKGITVTGGPVSSTIQVAGDIGNIVNKAVSYKEYYEDFNGRRRSTTNYSLAGMDVDLTSAAGKVGNIAVTGGDVFGQITAPAGIGKVSVTGADLAASLTTPNGMIAGIQVTAKVLRSPEMGMDEVRGGSMTAEINAGAVKGKSIGSISVTGGELGGTIQVAGDIGSIVNKWIAYKEYELDENMRTRSATSYMTCGLTAQVRSDAGKVGNITVTGGDVTAWVEAPAGIGVVSVVGGHFQGMLTAANGAIGGVKAGCRVVYQGVGMGREVVLLGGDVGAILIAGSVKGKSIGDIVATGGALGLDIQAAGNVGNLRSTSYSHRWSTSDGYGGKTWSIGIRPAGVDVTLNSDGKVGGISLKGGDFVGTVNAAEGIGKVSVTGGNVNAVLATANGAVAGLKVVAKVSPQNGEGEIVGGDLSGRITAGQAKGNAVGQITVTGGIVNGLIIEAEGNVAGLANQGMKYTVRYEDGDGRMRSATQYQTCGVMGLNVTSYSGDVGKLTVKGGDLEGVVHAENGAAVGISGNAVKTNTPEEGVMCWGGNISAEVVAASIGSLKSVGGGVMGTLTSAKIGSVTAKAITVDAKVHKWREWGEQFCEVIDGQIFGAPIYLEISALDEGATMGAFTTIGGEAHVYGVVSFDVASAKIDSKPVTYIQTYDENENGKLVAVRETVGGPGWVSNGLTNPVEEP